MGRGSRGLRQLAALLLAGLAVQFGAGQTKDQEAAGEPNSPSLTLDVLEDFLGQVTELIGGQVPGQPPQAPVTPKPETARGNSHGIGEVTQLETGLLDVHVRDMEIATVLEMLSYQANANIVTSTSVSGRISANLYSVTLEQALDAILTPNQYAFRDSGNTVFVGTKEELAALRPPPVTQVFRLRYISPAEAATAAKAALGADANVVKGGGESEEGGSKGQEEMSMGAAGVDYLIVTDYPQRLAVVEQLLAEIDQRPRQVLIEATVLRATLSETNQFGIDFSMLGGVDFENVGSASHASADLATGLLPSAQLQDTTFNINTNFTGAVNAGGFTFGLIKDSIAGFVRALEEITDVVVVANPKIVALNKQPGEVIVGRRDGYITTTVTETAAIQTVEFLETGTQIKFRPVINDDGTVRLSVHPKDSNGGLSAANLPFEETTEAHANILVDDGNTILIGGLFRERTVNSKSQLPVLGDIPLAGLLFGNRNDQTIREEVIILLTVHILKETEQEQSYYRELLEDVERIRVGSRRGLVGTGRERLAQAYFHEALARLEQDDRKLALLNLRMTLNNQPKHLAALKLLERLLDERMWDDEGTRMRTFIWEMIQPEPLPEHTPAQPMFGRPSADAEVFLPAADPAQGTPP
ncbi:MAG: hypothetical protein KAY37_00035 [Phycisphaerae bacterium]|nr:hypothetical protein [Phycisphaerae bacterium]